MNTEFACLVLENRWTGLLSGTSSETQNQKTSLIFRRLFLQGKEFSLCAWKRNVIRSSEHTREASLTSADLHHSVQWQKSLASGSYTQNNLLAPSLGLKTTLLSHNFFAKFTLNVLCHLLYRMWKLFNSLWLIFLMPLLMTGSPLNTEYSRLASDPTNLTAE